MLRIGVVGLALCAVGQDAPYRSEPRRGTNYDPPPRPQEKPPATPAPANQEPALTMPEIDWGARETWVKLGLLMGAIVLARKAFREMKS